MTDNNFKEVFNKIIDSQARLAEETISLEEKNALLEKENKELRKRINELEEMCFYLQTQLDVDCGI